MIVHKKLEDLQVGSQLMEYVLEQFEDPNLKGFVPNRPGLDGDILFLQKVDDNVAYKDKIGMFKKFGFELVKVDEDKNMVKHKDVWRITKAKEQRKK